MGILCLPDNAMIRSTRYLLLIFSMIGALSAQVIITELSAISNDRVFHRNSEGVAQLNSGEQWWENDFDTTFWNDGTTPIGFGYGDIATDVSASVRDRTPTLYLRHSFNLSAGQASSGQTLSLLLDYDDSFIAYLNGKEIARADAAAPGSPHYASQISYNSNTANGTGSTFSIGVANQYLTGGDNVLAIEIHNESIDSGDLKAKATLSTPSTTYVNSGDSCKWFPGVISPSGGIFDPAFASSQSTLFVPWGALDFDVLSWPTGDGPVGYETSGSNPYALGTNLSSMRNNQTGLYMRTTFELTAAELAAITTLQLEVDYDDGFIAYLNGYEVARGNLGSPGDVIPYDATTSGSHGASTDNGGAFGPDLLTISKENLIVGTNVLAGQVHNSSSGSSDLILHMALRSTGAGGVEFVEPDALYSYFIGTAEPSGGATVSKVADLEFSDWIELHNPTGAPVDISGWGISDDALNPAKSIFPVGMSIPAGGYLLVLADEQDEFNDVAQYFHTSFQLSSDGEDLVLTDSSGVVQSSIPGGFPKQYSRQSYGWDSANTIWGYFDHPTPGKANGVMTLSERVDSPDFSSEGGFYESTVTLTLTTNTPGASIRYTTDGSEPTATAGILYASPLSLSTINNKTGHVIKARAFKPGLIDSKPKIHTYLVGQDSRLKNVPALIFTGDENETFFGDHGIMSINGGSYVNSQWVENGPTSYNIPMKRGPEYERPLFVELYKPDGSLRFREEAGVRLSSSGYSRPRLILSNTGASPWTNNPREKPSFNLYFRDDYGAPKLESNWIEHDYNRATYSKLPAHLIGGQYPVNDFGQLRIRAGKNDIENPFIVDEAVRRMFVQMGQKGSVGRINTLYVNGEYKGFYNMCERLREPFMQAHHGGNKGWDVRQVNDYPNGDVTAWNEMIGILERSGGGDLSLSDWQEALGHLDPVNMADYFLINIYGATWDWPQNNWVGAKERSSEGRYRLYVWDAEGSYQNQGYFNAVNYNSIADDLLAQSDTLSQLFQLLIKSPEWRLTFADRINKHMFHDGVLDHRNQADSTFRQHLLALEEDYEPLLDFGFGESVNLGFYATWSSPTTGRRRYLLGGEGAPAQGGDRTDFADNGLWPSVVPPEFSQHGGDLSVGFPVTISASGGAQIYYTLDGSDPRDLGGTIQSGLSPYSSALTFSPGRTMVKARAYESGSSTWSALSEVEFVVDLAVPSASNLVISEFMYHPAAPSASELAAGHTDQDDFEFIEIMNTSPTDTIDLINLSFTGGVSFNFAGSAVTELAPGERAIVVSDSSAFLGRYSGFAHPVAGEYGGGLSNSSETVTLSVNDPTPTVLHSFTYDDEPPWPDCGDGLGYSLVLVSPNSNPDHTDPVNWTCSEEFGGSLNGNALDFDYATWADFNFSSSQLLDLNIVGFSQDPDGDGRNNYLEFVFGTAPNVPDVAEGGISIAPVEVVGVDYVSVEFTRSGFASGVTYALGASPDLTGGSWAQIPGGEIEAAAPVLLPDGRIRESWRVTTPVSDLSQRYFRLEISSP